MSDWSATQEHRPIAVSSPLGADVLLLRHMSGQERLGQPFEYQLDLLSDDHDLALEDLLGQPMTVRLALGEDAWRYFNGIVTRFAYVGSRGPRARYRATLSPWLALLNRSADCRIFQEQTVPDIVKSVFREFGFSDFSESLSGTYRPWTYCVQYRETAFNFVNRLLEGEGIYYFIRHQDGKHEVVLCDAPTAHEPFPGREEILFRPPVDAGIREEEYISYWRLEQKVQTGAYALTDFDFEAPRKNLRAQRQVSQPYEYANLEFFDYPGGYRELDPGETYARTRIEELKAQQAWVHGEGNGRGIGVGTLFRLAEHPRQDQNQEFLVVEAHYELESDPFEAIGEGQSGPVFQVSFRALDNRIPYRAPRVTPKPVVQGPQTAIVVGKSGEEIWTDKYGRVKVQFHWDRRGERNENSSCWVRVAQIWAGDQWGGIHIPRMGQEVVVSFLEGDPDQPLVTGRVYNGDRMPPYGLPANQTQSGIKSRSSKGGGPANFNEFRFEDKKGAEQVYFHAERNLDSVIEADETRDVGHNRDTKIHNDEFLTVDANRKTHVKGDFTELVDGNETRTVNGSVTETVNSGETRTINAGATETINGGETRTVNGGIIETVVGAVTQKVTAAVTETIGAALTQTVTGPITVTCGGPYTITATGGMTILAPGGTRFIDFSLSQLGGDLFETYGKKIKATPINLEVNAFKAEVHGLKIDGGALFNRQAGLQLKKLGARLLACDSANLNKAGLYLAKAGAHLIG